MKGKLSKISLIMSILIAIFLLTFIPHKLVDVDPQDVSSIYIFDGRSGHHIEIKDKDTINYIIENLDSVTFQKGKPTLFRMGAGLRVTIYTNKYFPYKKLIINTDNNVRYWGFFYGTKVNKIDYKFLQNLLK